MGTDRVKCCSFGLLFEVAHSIMVLVAPGEAAFLASFSAVCESPALNLFREGGELKRSSNVSQSAWESERPLTRKRVYHFDSHC